MSKILVIDDDEIIRALASEALRANGYEVLTAEDGDSGIKLARQQHPDLIIVDLLMPQVHGYVVVDKIRRDRELDRARIIISSILVPDVAVGAFADRFLKKPYDPQSLVEMVAEVLSSEVSRVKPSVRGQRREEPK